MLRRVNKWVNEEKLDEENWALNYKQVGKCNIRITGKNAYPEVWEDFVKVLEECFEI